MKFFYNNILNNNYYCNYHIADHAAAAAAAAAAADDDDGDVDGDGDADGDSFKFQMLSINMLTMILMSNISTTAITLACPSLSHACRCRDGRTPLHLSARWGNAEVAKLLVELKADLAAVDE